MSRTRGRGRISGPRLRAVVGAVALIAGLCAGVAGSGVAAHAAPQTGSYGLFTPVTPARVYDSRTVAAGALVGGQARDVVVSGADGFPADGVLAVVANVTVTSPTAAGFLTVFPAGGQRPFTSNLNFVPAQTVANLVTVGVSDAGAISLYTNSGKVHVVVDVTGYYAKSDGPTGSRFTATAATRILGVDRGGGEPIAGGTFRDVQVAGAGGVPVSATAVAFNVTVSRPTSSSFVTVYPAGGSSPVSTLNFVAGQTIANQTVVRLGDGGRISIFNNSGRADVALDVLGYYADNGARFYPLPPTRWMDTEMVHGSHQGLSTAFGAHAVIANVTAANSRAPGYLSVSRPDTRSQPTIHFRALQVVPNLVTVGVDGSGGMVIGNMGDRTRVIVDVFGEFHLDGSEPRNNTPPPQPTPEPAPQPAPSGGDVQPAFPIRAAFYYPWYTSKPQSRFTPTSNPYNVEDPAFLAYQVRVMRYAGMNAGIAHWGMSYLEDQRFPKLLRAADGTAFRWSIQYEPEGRTDGSQPTVAKIRADLNTIKTKYGADRSFLRVGGKPVVFVWTDASDGCAMTQRWRDANSTVGMYVVLKRFTGYLSCPAQPNSWHQYAPAGRIADVRPHAFSVSPGFYSAWESSPRLGRDPAGFATAVQQMIASRAQWQLVTTFNEWGEGTAVESANEWRSASGSGVYVDILHRYLGTTR